MKIFSHPSIYGGKFSVHARIDISSAVQTSTALDGSTQQITLDIESKCLFNIGTGAVNSANNDIQLAVGVYTIDVPMELYKADTLSTKATLNLNLKQVSGVATKYARLVEH